MLSSGNAGQVFPKNAKYPLFMDKFKTVKECDIVKNNLSKQLGVELICVEVKKI